MTNDKYFELNFLREWFSTPRAMTKQNRVRLKRLQELTIKCFTLEKIEFSIISAIGFVYLWV